MQKKIIIFLSLITSFYIFSNKAENITEPVGKLKLADTFLRVADEKGNIFPLFDNIWDVYGIPNNSLSFSFTRTKEMLGKYNNLIKQTRYFDACLSVGIFSTLFSMTVDAIYIPIYVSYKWYNNLTINILSITEFILTGCLLVFGIIEFVRAGIYYAKAKDVLKSLIEDYNNSKVSQNTIKITPIIDVDFQQKVTLGLDLRI